MPQISVVVPVYNAEPFLHECMDSLLKQTFRDTEFIFVDDGSTDRSLEILKDYQAKDARITILQQQNQYAGVARNNGMKLATGKYIIFLDSDDFFEPTMLEEAFNCAEENQAEIVYFNFSYYDNVSGTISKAPSWELPSSVFSVSEIGKRFFRSYRNEPWNKLFLREFILSSGLQFQSVRKGNDSYFTNMAACLSKRMKFLNRYLTYYRVNNNSSLQGSADTGRTSFIVPFSAVKSELIHRELFNGAVKEAFNEHICRHISHFGHLRIYRSEQLKSYYTTIKDNLIPLLFEKPEEFDTDPYVKLFYYSKDFEEFIFEAYKQEVIKNEESIIRIKSLYDSRVSKNSFDYRIGHMLLAFPRWFIGLFQSSKSND